MSWPVMNREPSLARKAAPKALRPRFAVPLSAQPQRTPWAARRGGSCCTRPRRTARASGAAFEERFGEVPVVELINVIQTQFRLVRFGNHPPNRGTLCAVNDSAAYLFTPGYVREFETYPGLHIPTGFRMRAQEVAQEWLGDLSRADAERRIWRETQADRFTGFDRRLLQAADSNLEVEDGVGGTDAWSALLRGRLRHLEVLGLATRRGHRFRLHDDLERELRALQLRRDVIRTLHQRRLDMGRQPAELDDAAVKGRVVKAGHFDQLGSSSWVIVRDGEGREHFARLRFGQSAPKLGRTIELVPTAQGAQIKDLGRSADLGR
jgi:hypothetical protein